MINSPWKLHNRLVIAGFFALGAALASGLAQAFQFDMGPVNASLDNTITIGSAWRLENRDPRIIGKSNLQPGLCTARRSDGTLGNMEGHDGTADGSPGNIGFTCNDSDDPSVNAAYVREPGFFSPNGDNGNLNYERKEMVNAAAKYTADLNLKWGEFGAFIRGIYFFDNINNDFLEKHPDTTVQPAFTGRSSDIEDNIGTDFDVLDGYVTWNAPFFGDRTLTVRVGDQVVNWGESAFLAIGSINNINPPDATRLRIPGFDVKELFQPAGLVYFSTDITESISTELFYQYEWIPVVPDQAGSFFSTSDIAGGGTYAMLSFAKAPEDPNQSYRPSDNANDAAGPISSSSRTLLRGPDRNPEDGGQYGISLKYLAEWLNEGTELGFYHQRYHSRLPLASLTASNATCIGEGTTTAVQLAVDCGLGGPNGNLGATTLVNAAAARGIPIPPELAAAAAAGTVGLTRDPLPFDTATIFLEYPEDINLWGLSFNTALGDWAWSGEVAYRPNNPLQIHPVDITLAAVNPAFPNNAVDLLVGVLPNRRLAAPDYVTSFRGRDPSSPQGRVQPNEYIQGFERFKTYNIETTFLRTIGGDNWLKAAQIVVLLELGATHVVDLPSLNELQLSGTGTDTHYGRGADSTQAPGTRDNADLTNSAACGTGATQDACRQNPTQQTEGFPTDWSYGYRFVSLIRYQDAFLGVNLEPLIGVFHDIGGYSPGPGGNFIKDRVVGLFGLRFDYLSKWNGEIRYTDISGGAEHNDTIDRDFLMLFVGYTF